MPTHICFSEGHKEKECSAVKRTTVVSHNGEPGPWCFPQADGQSGELEKDGQAGAWPHSDNTPEWSIIVREELTKPWLPKSREQICFHLR